MTGYPMSALQPLSAARTQESMEQSLRAAREALDRLRIYLSANFKPGGSLARR